MTYAQPSTAFEARVNGFASGLTGTVGVQIRDNIGGVSVARTTSGIAEDPAGSGSYVATLTAPADAGQYTVFWDGGVVSPSTTASEELVVNALGAAPVAPSSETPTLEEVGALLRTRTTARGGTAELGTFTPDTRPTGDQVLDLINKAVWKVAEKVGTNLPDALLDPAREAAALRAAMLVELSFFGDQIRAGRSPYNELKKLADEALADLYAAKLELGADATIGTDDDLSTSGAPGVAYPAGSELHAPGSELGFPSGTGWMRW